MYGRPNPQDGRQMADRHERSKARQKARRAVAKDLGKGFLKEVVWLLKP